jgi:PAS domain S-box-containing protein
MRIIHKGLILILVPLIPAALTIAVLFAIVEQTYRDTLEDNRQVRLITNAVQALLVYNDIMIRLSMVAVQEDVAGCKARIREDMQRWQSLRNEAANIDPQALTKPGLLKDTGELLDALRNGMQDLQELRQAHASAIMYLSKTDQLAEWQYVLEEQLLEGIPPKMQQTLHHLDERRRFQQHNFQMQRTTLIAAVIGSILCGCLLSWWFTTNIVARIRLLAENMTRFSRNQPLHPVMTGNDEIAVLDRGFHNMASRLQEAMKKERALFECASDIICVTDETFRITAVNPAWTSTLGYSEAESIGQELSAFIVQSDRQRTQDLVQSLKSSTPAAKIDSQAMHRDGATLYLAWSVYWSAADTALYAIAHDISDRKRVERAKEEFLYTVSHDLRAPLSSIRASMEYAANEWSEAISKEARQKISTVKHNVGRLLMLLDGLLDLDKIESGKLQLVKDWSSVDETLRLAVNEIDPLAKAKQIRIELHSKPAEIYFDADRFIQVVVNLLANAVRHSPTGGTITVDEIDCDDHLEISIEDEGPGVPVDERETIFQKFKQARSNDYKGGSGLGLSICKLIVEQHGGKIWVEAASGGGSRFVVHLPKTVENSTPTAVAQSMQLDSTATQQTLNTAKQTQPGKFSLANRFANLRIVHKVAILISLPIAFELAFAGVAFGLLQQAGEQSHRELGYHTFAVAFEESVANYLLAGLGLFGRVSLNEKWSNFNNRIDAINQARQRHERLLAPYPEVGAFVRRSDELSAPLIKFLKRAIELHRDYAYYGDQRWTGSYEERLSYLPIYLKAMKMNDLAMADASSNAIKVGARLAVLRNQQQRILIGGLSATLIICLGSALAFGQGIAGRLRVTEDKVARLESGEPLDAPLIGKDEVAQLDQFFHAMAAALQEVRRKERAIFDNSQDLICAVGGDDVILRINPAGKRLFGASPGQLVGAAITSLFPKELVPHAQSVLSSVREQRQSQSFDCPIVRPDGSSCPILWSLAWSETEQAVIAIGCDMTAREELEKLKRDFLAMVSHDMRTPLMSISETTRMLREGAFGTCPDEMVSYLEIVTRNCGRLLSLINDLLDLERLEAGQMQLAMKSVSADSILQRTAQTLSGLSGEKNISVHVDTDPDLIFTADLERLVQVTVNLLSNALKFSPEGSTITLSARAQDDSIEFRVKDSGCGIAESQHTVIFERYGQVASQTINRKDGKGLGLTICKNIVEQHGGVIGVESALGKGSTFYFRIPKSGPEPA